MKKFLLNPLTGAALVAFACLPLAAPAQDYPVKPVHIVIE